MKIYKFGGAALKDAQGFKNVVGLIAQAYEKDLSLLVVVSALNKTTNGLEKVVDALWNGQVVRPFLEPIIDEHTGICQALELPVVAQNTEQQLLELQRLKVNNFASYDALYDEVVAQGELLSSTILAAYTKSVGVNSQWVDVREVIKTNDNHRAAEVDAQEIEISFPKYFSGKEIVFVTQGFIGRTLEGLTTTLGREGSDYTASLLARAAGAKELTVWKDVAGILNADPKKFAAAQILHHLPYRQAAEMTYYGASVIHPRTLEPLVEAGIALRVKSFLQPDQPGTVVGDSEELSTLPLIMQISNCVLITVKALGFSYISDHHVAHVLSIAAECFTKTLLIQHSAMSVSLCVPQDIHKSRTLIELLEKHYAVNHHPGLDLFTIKNPLPALEAEISARGYVMIAQRTKATTRLLMRLA